MINDLKHNKIVAAIQEESVLDVRKRSHNGMFFIDLDYMENETIIYETLIFNNEQEYEKDFKIISELFGF